MSKVLCIGAMSVSLLLFILFLLDLTLGIPFNKADSMMDLGFIVATGLLSALSFLCLRKLK